MSYFELVWVYNYYYDILRDDKDIHAVLRELEQGVSQGDIEPKIDR